MQQMVVRYQNEKMVYNHCSGGHFAKYWGGGGGRNFQHVCLSGVGLRYANLSNIMLGIQAFKIRIQAFKIRIQAFKIRIQVFKIRIQAFKIRIQAFKIRIQAFKIRYAYIYWCVSLFHLLLNNTNCDLWCLVPLFLQIKIIGGGGGGLVSPLVSATG